MCVQYDSSSFCMNPVCEVGGHMHAAAWCWGVFLWIGFDGRGWFSLTINHTEVFSNIASLRM